ncbi:MAG TPA: integrase arm-type DNA-binding domain-containing protein [Candidatus Binataceae bacterium]|nr:integrase arm-type DNA-binding domain-containing protein [Candidatus Binataceae bacterium]
MVDFTTVAIASAKVLPEDWPHLRTDYWDRKLKGFGLRVANSGRKTWFVSYRHHGIRRRLTLGTCPPMWLADARKAAQRALGKVAEGHDPSAEKAAQRAEEAAKSSGLNSFETVARLYLDEYISKKRPATQKQYRHVVESRLIPAWRDRAVRDIGRSDVKALIRAIQNEGHDVLANRVAAIVGGLFGWVVEQHSDLLDSSPALKLGRTKEYARETVLRDQEIQTLWRALEQEPLLKAAYVKLCLLSGQRRAEVLGASWAEIDLDTAWWTIPATRTKNKRPHRVYLAPQALVLVKAIRAAAPASNTHVFPGQILGRPKTNPQDWIDDIRDRTGVALRLHDLRRTASTLLARNGVRSEIISRIINHTLPGDTNQIYNQYGYDKEKRAGLTKLDSVIQRIVEGRDRQDDKVVALHAS